MLVFTPERLAVMKGAPALRRRYLDRAVARSWPRYAAVAGAYAGALQQRNQLLRRLRAGARAHDALAPWEAQLAQLGSEIRRARGRFVLALREPFAEHLAAIGELDEPVEAADGSQVPRERLAQSRYEARACTAHLGSQLRQLRLPGRQRVMGAGTGTQAAQQLVALLERARIGARHAGIARPGARDGAVQIAAAERRGALHHGQALGREDEQRRVLGQGLDRRAGGAVEGGALGRARLEPDRPFSRDAAQRPASLDARDLGADADHAGVVRGAGRPRQRSEVHRLEQARLARAVAPHDRQHLTAQLAVEPVVAAEVRGTDVLDAHRGAV